MRRLQSVRTRTNALKSVLGYAGSTSEVKCCCRVFRSSGVLRRSSKVLRRAAVWGRSKGPPPASKLNGIPMFPRAAVKAPCLGVPSCSSVRVDLISTAKSAGVRPRTLPLSSYAVPSRSRIRLATHYASTARSENHNAPKSWGTTFAKAAGAFAILLGPRAAVTKPSDASTIGWVLRKFCDKVWTLQPE